MTKQLTRMVVAFSAAFWVAGALAENAGHKHHDFAKDVDAFHAALAPVWHMSPGKERSQKACANAAEMVLLAKDIQSADARPLIAALATLGEKCKGKLAAVDAAFFDVHEAFHHLIEASAPAAKP